MMVPDIDKTSTSNNPQMTQGCKFSHYLASFFPPYWRIIRLGATEAVDDISQILDVPEIIDKKVTTAGTGKTSYFCCGLSWRIRCLTRRVSARK
jgi:hypothetical protein